MAQRTEWLLAACMAACTVAAQPARAQDRIDIRIENTYVATLNLGFGTGVRGGIDRVEGTLTFQPDGTWTGEVTATIKMSQELTGLGVTVCPQTEFNGTQKLDMLARRADGFSDAQTITYRNGTADAGHLTLEVTPKEPPQISPTGPCLDMVLIEVDGIPTELLPLNDARWTQPPYGYVIGLPQSGVLEYDDLTVAVVGLEFKDPSDEPVLANSTWEIRVERF